MLLMALWWQNCHFVWWLSARNELLLGEATIPCHFQASFAATKGARSENISCQHSRSTRKLSGFHTTSESWKSPKKKLSLLLITLATSSRLSRKIKFMLSCLARCGALRHFSFRLRSHKSRVDFRMPEKKCTTASCEEAAPRGAEVKQKKYLKVFSDSVGVFGFYVIAHTHSSLAHLSTAEWKKTRFD